MKKILSTFSLLLISILGFSQNPFFQVVDYRGAFAPAPTAMWTDSWTNWDPQNTTYGTPTVNVSGTITSNTTWTSGNVYLLQGPVYVKNGAILTIQPGTVIRGDNSIANSALIITKGSRINAVGTSTQPIVFTSSKDAGSRAVGDWGGIIVLGKASLNRPGGTANIEGLATSSDTEYGGGSTPDDNDNSGNLKYVRIEYGGYVFATDQEINGLTLGAVGRNTVVDFVQCSFINDDAFEWFGGTVNCAHLVAYRCLDDNWDSDFGFRGSVQFALGVRDPNISDQSAGSTSEGFESDNDGTGSSNTPQTAAVFSNVTEIGPFRGATLTSWGSSFKFRRAIRIRRNSGLKLLNSIFTDYPYGIFPDGTAVRANLQSGVTVIKNNIVAGCFLATEPTISSAIRDSLYGSTKFKNDSLTSTSGLLVNPYDYTSPDYRPVASTSPALSNVNFDDASFNNRKIIVSSASSIKEVTFRGAFAPSPAVMWTEGWTNWDPKNTVYPSATVTVSGNITSNTTWSASNTYLLSGLVYVNDGVTLTIEPGTVILGDATVANSALIVTKGAKLIANGTVSQPIVFTSSKPAGSRSLGDWGGVILLGRASLNRPGGVANIEGIAATSSTEYGGGASPNDNDNSGSLKYVRIEFGGYVFATDQEINGLTLGAVGRATTIDYVQCSYVNDDAFEWFGGTVNCAHLVAYRCLDDNWDSDFGYSGSVQFGLGVRDPDISDQSAGSTSEGFESDNDGNGSSNTPQTKGLFTNITEIGPFRGTKIASPVSTFKFRRAARIRRNSGMKLFNSILTDYPTGLFLDGSAVRNNLQTGVTKFKNNLIAGCNLPLETGTATTVRDSIFNSGTGFFKNDSLTTTTGILISPYNYLNPDYRPGTNPLVTTGAAFTDEAFNGLIVPCDEVNAPESITGNANIFGCTNPQTYSIPVISNASSYTWTVPAGVTIVSGQGTRTITVNYATTFTTGTISVVGKNDCGNTSVAASRIIRKVSLGIPSTIAGTPLRTNVCGLVGTDTTITYRINSVAGASTYTWVTPSNTQIINGGTAVDTSITLKFLSGYTTSIAGDTLRVTIFASSCQATKQAKLSIKAALPAAPAAITITSMVTNVCGARKYRYSAPALPVGATGYDWSFIGNLYGSASIDSGGLSSQKLILKFTSNDASQAGDSARVRYISNCGFSSRRSIKLNNTKLNPPAAPTISITKLSDKACGQPKFRYRAAALKTATTTAGAATAWDWTFVGTLGSKAVIDSGTSTSQVITVYFTDTASSKAGDSVKCRYNSACGYGPYGRAKLSNTKTGIIVPIAPSSIIVSIVSDSCGNRVYRYTAPTLAVGTTIYAAATGYLWTLPTGTLGSTGVLDSGLLSSRVIRIRYSSNASAGVGDSIRVRFTSLCGNGQIRALKLSNLAKVCIGGKAIQESGTPIINETNLLTSKIYPNPNKGQFTLEVNNTGVKERAVVKIELVDMMGNLISQHQGINESGIIRTNISEPRVSNGTYFVRFRIGDKQQVVRMMVIK